MQQLDQRHANEKIGVPGGEVVEQTADQLFLVIKGLLTQAVWSAPITGMRLMLMGLKPAALGQLALTSYLKPQRPRELEQLLSSLQAKFGADRIFTASDISIPRRERMLQLLTGFGDHPIPALGR